MLFTYSVAICFTSAAVRLYLHFKATLCRNNVIVPSLWSNKSDGGGGSVTRHCTINMILKLLFQGQKLHDVALNVFFPVS